MKQYIWDELDNKTKQILKETGEKNKHLDMQYNIAMNQYHKNIDVVMRQYIDIKKMSYAKVENAYGQLDFFQGNRNIKKAFIFERLHKKQRDLCCFLKQRAWHFEQYYVGQNGNISVMIDKILEVQDKIFCKTQNKMGYTISNDFGYDIDTELYKLLKYTYGKNYEGLIPDKKTYLTLARFLGTDVDQSTDTIKKQQ